MRLDSARSVAQVAGIAVAQGVRFGRLVIIEEGEPYFWRGRFSRRRWRCLCDCGAETEVRDDQFKSGRTISCGCARDEAGRERLLRHGARSGNCRTPEYDAWQAMLRRFGSDGVVGEWRLPDGVGFSNFFDRMGLRPGRAHTLSRLDSRKPFGPGNCIWSIEKLRRPVPRRMLDVDGQRMSLRSAALSYGIGYSLLCKRLQRGWPPQLALGIAVGQRQPGA